MVVCLVGSSDLQLTQSVVVFDGSEAEGEAWAWDAEIRHELKCRGVGVYERWCRGLAATKSAWLQIQIKIHVVIQNIRAHFNWKDNPWVIVLILNSGHCLCRVSHFLSMSECFFFPGAPVSPPKTLPVSWFTLAWDGKTPWMCVCVCERVVPLEGLPSHPGCIPTSRFPLFLW